LSLDEGQTWSVSRLINAQPSAYSCLAALTDGAIGLLYETGLKHPYETIAFVSFDLDWVRQGEGKQGL
jgi:sialidase-1